MSDRKYSKDHEWVTVDGGIGTVGISDHAQEQLGEIVFVDLPDVGKAIVHYRCHFSNQLWRHLGSKVLGGGVIRAIVDTPNIVQGHLSV